MEEGQLKWHYVHVITAVEVIPILSTVWLFSRMHRIFMWLEVGGHWRKNINILPHYTAYKNVHGVIMGLAYRRCLTHLPWRWNWTTSCDAVPCLLSLIVQSLATQSVVHAPATWASSGSLSEMQNLRPRPRPLNQNLHFNKIPGHLHAQWLWVALV